jgi:hypothetical protein
MKTTLKSRQSILSAMVLLGVMLPLAPARAQTVAPDLARAAQDACINVAKSRGFTLDRVVEVTADGVDAAKAVLTLTRDGQTFRLTCGYSKTKGAMFGSEPPATNIQVPTPAQPSITIPSVPVASAPDLSRLWWLLLPLIGLPLLLWFAKGKRDEVVTEHYDVYEGIVRKIGGVDVRSGPGASYKVTGSLNDGQRVVLSGRHENSWSQLQDGGWIPSEHVETFRYAER